MRRTCIACGIPIAHGSRCPTHRLRNGSGTGWRRLRAEVLLRDGHVCQLCGAKATHVDHKVAVLHGGTDYPDNLQALCQRCNLEKGTRR